MGILFRCAGYRGLIYCDLVSSRKQAVSMLYSTKVASFRSEHKDTATIHEKELFGKILRSILAKQNANASSLVPDSKDRISFASTASFADAINSSYSINPTAEVDTSRSDLKHEHDKELAHGRFSPEFRSLHELVHSSTRASDLSELVESRVLPFLASAAHGASNSTRSTAFIALCKVYPYLLAQAMQVMRLTFRDFQGVINVFERISKHGPTSAVSGAHAVVYNELLLARWNGWHQVTSIIETIEDMRINGVRGNQMTAEILRRIVAEVILEKSDSDGSRLLWQTEDPINLETLSRHCKIITDSREAQVD